MKLSLLRQATQAIASVVPITPPWKLIPPSHNRSRSQLTVSPGVKWVNRLGLPVPPPPPEDDPERAIEEQVVDVTLRHRAAGRLDHLRHVPIGQQQADQVSQR